MIVPSIDIVGGRAVQLVGGETLSVDAGNPKPLMDRFSVVGEVAVIDIDAARGDSNNVAVIADLCTLGRVRVGGGIRDIDTALSWLDTGADKIIVGTAATPAFLEELPRERVIVALDARDGAVVTHGWRKQTDRPLIDSVAELSDLCGGFLVTFVEREGRLEGTDMALAEQVIAAAGDASVTIAGGITTTDEIAALDLLGADAQVGMALYTEQLSLADAMAAPLVSDRSDGLWPTIVADESGVALGLAWSDAESLTRAIETRTGIYHSRTRGLWQKGASSGATQRLLRIDVDCDRDALRFMVEQNEPGFCHTGTRTCFGDDGGIGRLARRIETIRRERPSGSNTVALFDDDRLLANKLLEEAGELVAATTTREVLHETADLIYFTLAKAVASGVSIRAIETELDAREQRITRRPMTSKEIT
ncbi:MAG: phosphoribosyl-ATP diphosphatase [Acidimicrobiia bacterium]|nr:phosphoribosyl-ATP diphosphatase [Acidimicrobiia bacterium]